MSALLARQRGVAAVQACRDKPRVAAASVARGPRAAARRAPARVATAPYPASAPRSRRSQLCRAGASAVQQPASSAGAGASPPPLPALNANYEAQCAFSAFASWLIPGRLLMGRYPYVDPDHATTYDLGEAQLDEIVARGPHVFVCLQAELPPQGEMPIGGRGGFLPYKSVVELMAAAHTPPPPGDVVNGVRNPKIDQFLPARRKAAAPEVDAYYKAEQVAFLHWAIPEGGVPTQDMLAEIVRGLKARLARGDSIYLHDRRGTGRAALVGAALLAAVYGLSADEALERVQRSLDTRCDGGSGVAPESDAQRAAVRTFAERAHA